VGKAEQERSAMGNEFQMVGAAPLLICQELKQAKWVTSV